MHYSLRAHDSNITDIQQYKKLLLTCSKDGKIKFWNKKIYKCVKLLNNVHKNGVVSMNVHKN